MMCIVEQTSNARPSAVSDVNDRSIGFITLPTMQPEYSLTVSNTEINLLIIESRSGKQQFSQEAFATMNRRVIRENDVLWYAKIENMAISFAWLKIATNRML